MSLIHIATVHWADPAWLPVQRRFLDRHVGEPYRLWAFLGRMRDYEREHRDEFHYTNTLPIKRHEWKLNLLADLICAESHDRPEDVIVFIDGDAFPIAPLGPFLRSGLERAPLIAVRRDENVGDLQPHPCFCATTVGFWRQIRGDWSPGGRWVDARGESITDVGGNLMRLLEEGGHRWTPLLRSNQRDLHPLLFGIYGNLVYHHGGGFRPGAGGRVFRAGSAELAGHPISRLFARLPKRRFEALRRRFHPRAQARRAAVDQVQETSARVFELIERDDDFHRLFLDPGYEGELADVRLGATPERPSPRAKPR